MAGHPALALPPKARTVVYAIIGIVSLAVGAAQVGFAAVDQPAPDWLTVALAVVPFLAAGLGYTAATHVPSAPDYTAPVDDGYVGKHREEGV